MTASKPLVSVVLPAHDAADTVADAVASILDQTFRDIELVVVDDGSTDDTSQVLSGIDDPRLIVLQHDTNRGHVAALQTGIDRARAPVIARMDADDVALPTRLDREYEILYRRPAVGLVSTAFVSVDAEGRELQQHGVPPDHAAVWFRLHFANCLAHPTVMFRRSAYERTGGYDARVVPADDHDLWLRMAEVVEIATIPDALLCYRRSPSSVTARAGDRVIQQSVEVAVDSIERAIGVRPAARIVAALRVDGTRLGCDDAPAVVDVVLPVYRAIGSACAERGIPTHTLPGQLAAVLALGGLRGADGRWCRRGIAHLARRHPRTATALVREWLGSRTRRVTPRASEPSSGSGSPAR